MSTMDITHRTASRLPAAPPERSRRAVARPHAVPQTHHDRPHDLASRTHERLVLARQGDQRDRSSLLEQVVLDHLWLARSLARRFEHRGEDADDLFQVASAGLVEASQRCDPDRGPFVAFATPTINGRLKRHFRDHGWMIRPARHTQELLLSIRRRWPELAQGLGAVPDPATLSAALGEEIGQVREAVRAAQGYYGSPLDSVDVADHGAGSRELEQCETHLVLDRAISRLSDADRQLLQLRYARQLTQSEIAVELSVSQMQVSRLLLRVHARLRGLIGSLDETS